MVFRVVIKNKVSIKKLLFFIAAASILFIVNYTFKQPINKGTRVLYMDDLNSYNAVYKDGSFIDAILDRGANKLRPVAYAILFMAYRFADTNFERLDILIFFWNLVIAIGVAWITFRLLEQKTGFWVRSVLSTSVGVLYSISRFSYYVWTEVFGLMESTALILALCILMLADKYISEEKEINLQIIDILYCIIIFTHERYILLAGVIIAAVLIKHGLKKPVKFIPSILTIAIFFAIRIFLFGSRFIDGTGGTSVIDTFNLKDMIKNVFFQTGYILGINAGPTYLNGIDYHEVSSAINLCILLQIIFAAACICIFAILVIKKHDLLQIKKSMIYLLFIFCCIISSSVTIRVEMRWIYVSYAAFLMYMAQIISYIILQMNAREWFLLGFVYLGLGFICENYYQLHYPNLYYWGIRSMTRSLYEETIGKYGEGFFQKNIYIVGNSMQWTEDTWKQFYGQFFKEDRDFQKAVYVEYMEELFDVLPETEQDSIILLEDTHEAKYVDISGIVSRGH